MIKKKVIFSVITLMLSCVAVLLLSEGVLRCWYFIHNQLEPPLAYRDDYLGWRPTAHLSFEQKRKNYGEISFTSTRDGFRRFGDVKTDKIKILVVGDSFTQAYHVSDGNAYYDYLASSDLQMEVFAIGVGGYGTLQQAMVLEQYLPLVSPDLILWQFSGNDFINNDLFLEAHSSENSSHMRRPFLQDGAIVHGHPDGAMGYLAEYSLLVRRCLVIRGSFRKRSYGSIEDQLDIKNPNLLRSVATTRQLVKRVVARYPDIPVMAFFAGRQHYSWELPAFAKVCELKELNCISQVTASLAASARSGKKIDGGYDRHWNGLGHALAGKQLVDAVRARLVRLKI